MSDEIQIHKAAKILPAFGSGVQMAVFSPPDVDGQDMDHERPSRENAHLTVQDPFGPAWTAAAAGQSVTDTNAVPQCGNSPVENALMLPVYGREHGTNEGTAGPSSGPDKANSQGPSTAGQPRSLADYAYRIGPFGPFYYRHLDSATGAKFDAVRYLWDPPQNTGIEYPEAGPAYLENTSTNTLTNLDNPSSMSEELPAPYPALPESTSTDSVHGDGSDAQPDSVHDDSGDAQPGGTASARGNLAKYLGDPNIPANMSADIPENQNTSLYISGMGPDTKFSDILAAIRGVGKVYSLYVNPPMEIHTGCAAKLTFFTRAAAGKFFNNTRGGFLVRGYSATVRWNRIRVPEQTIHKDGSRIVIIRGPKYIVNVKVISKVIDDNIRYYDMEKASLKPLDGMEGFAEMELHFGCFRAQAHSALIVLNRELGGARFRVSYGTDPCE